MIVGSGVCECGAMCNVRGGGLVACLQPVRQRERMSSGRERMISGRNCKCDVVLRVSCVRLDSYTHMVTDTRTHVYVYIYV